MGDVKWNCCFCRRGPLVDLFPVSLACPACGGGRLTLWMSTHEIVFASGEHFCLCGFIRTRLANDPHKDLICAKCERCAFKQCVNTYMENLCKKCK